MAGLIYPQDQSVLTLRLLGPRTRGLRGAAAGP